MATERITVVGSAMEVNPNEVSVCFDGVEHRGWTSLQITRRADGCPNDFSVGLTMPFTTSMDRRAGIQNAPFGADLLRAVPGAEIDIFIGRQQVLSGHVDRRNASLSPEGRAFSVTGRGRCADLVDCAAEWPGQRIINSTPLEIARKLAEPFGIAVKGVAGPKIGTPGDVIGSIGVPRGLRAIDVIEEACRLTGLLAFEDTDGALVLAQGAQGSAAQLGADGAAEWIRSAAGPRNAGTEMVASASGLEEGVNVKSAAAELSIDNRFSEYRAYRTGFDQLRDVSLPNLIAKATDPGVKRFRPTDLLVEPHPTLGLNYAEQRVKFEAAVRWGRAGAIKVTTDSWRDSAGQLYAPFTLMPVRLPSLGLPEYASWLVTEVTYLLDDGGTRCDLVLMHPLSFSRIAAIPASHLPRDVAALASQFSNAAPAATEGP